MTMKRLFLIYVALLFLFTHFVQASSIRFVEYSGYHLTGDLPPRIKVHFTLLCNQNLVRVIRHDTLDEKRKLNIAIGGLVEETDSNCDTSDPREFRAEGGEAFSGREYQVVPIRSSN